MCLETIIKQRFVADEDIICYKEIVSFDDYSVRNAYSEGDSFEGVINNVRCSGKIHYEGTRIYFCTNDFRLRGKRCNDTLGYEYSWMYEDVQELDKFNKAPDFKTEIMRMPIKIGETYKGELDHPNDSNQINVGFHAYTIQKRTCNVMCIIPKGSEFYIGFDDDIVSNCIKYEKLI